METMTANIFIENISKIKGDEGHNSSFFKKKNDIIQIEKIRVLEPLQILDKIFPSNIVIQNCFFDKVVFKNCIFEKDISFLRCTFKEIIFEENNKFKSLLEFGYPSGNGSKTISFGTGHYQNLKLEYLTNEASTINININGGNYKSLSLQEKSNGQGKVSILNKTTTVEELKIKFFKQNENSNIQINDAKINQINFTGEHSENNIIELNKAKLHSIKLDNFKNKGKIIFDNIVLNKEKGSLFEFNNNVVLGDFELNNVELDKFESVLIGKTDISKIKLFNSSFPAKSMKGDANVLYENFNILCEVAKSRNNKRDEIEYYRASKEALLNSLDGKRWENRSSFLSLWVSKCYSNHGTSWLQAVVAVLLIALFFFILMMWISNYNLDFSKTGWDNFCNLGIYYIQFLNPTHKLTFMDKQLSDFVYSEHFGFVIFDFIGRIFIGIGIYEIIRSFRQHARK